MPRFSRKKKDVYLTVDEIHLLFQATSQDALSPRLTSYKRFNMALQARDRAMLAVYYGCGLRGSEGVRLQLEDINFEKGLIYVRLTKNVKERFVPFNKAGASHLLTYINDYRRLLIAGNKTNNSLFLRIGGDTLTRTSMLLRLKRLQRLTADEVLISKPVVLHTLRHSIATHLLGAGMQPENIARFLGHTSLDTIQEYIHFDDRL